MSNNTTVEQQEEEQQQQISSLGRNHYLTGYIGENLQISKDEQILGWKHEPKKLKTGDVVYVYDITGRKIQTSFIVRCKSSSSTLIWTDEMKEKDIVYPYRFDVVMAHDNLDLSLEEIWATEPFIQKAPKGNLFNILIASRFPICIDEDRYQPFKSRLIQSEINRLFVEKKAKDVSEANEAFKEEWK